MKNWHTRITMPIIVAATAALGAGAGPASAAPDPKPNPNQPVPNGTDPFSILEGYKSACPGFDVTAQLTGKSKTIDLTEDRFISISPGTTITLTGEYSRKTVSYVITGSTHIQVLEDGGLELRSTGRNILIVPKTDEHSEGLFLTTGNVNYALGPADSEGYREEVRLFSGPGTVTNICELLE